ncbi:uncharacterized protein LOC126832174 isoform X2 [Patella vulgata]|nr:uncharacterized protein LOC126832174 isoform X2 [Patella vulgata]
MALTSSAYRSDDNEKNLNVLSASNSAVKKRKRVLGTNGHIGTPISGLSSDVNIFNPGVYKKYVSQRSRDEASENLDNSFNLDTVEMKGLAFLPDSSVIVDSNIISSNDLGDSTWHDSPIVKHLQLLRKRHCFNNKEATRLDDSVDVLLENNDLGFSKQNIVDWSMKLLERELLILSTENNNNNVRFCDINGNDSGISDVTGVSFRMDNKKPTDRAEESPGEGLGESVPKRLRTERQEETTRSLLIIGSSAASERRLQDEEEGSTSGSSLSESPTKPQAMFRESVSGSKISTSRSTSSSTSSASSEVSSKQLTEISQPTSELRSQEDAPTTEKDLINVTISMKSCGIIETKQASSQVSSILMGPVTSHAHIDTAVTVTTSRPTQPDLSTATTSRDTNTDNLLDSECVLYSSSLPSNPQDISPIDRGVLDPLAQILSQGDDRHFIPIDDETVADSGTNIHGTSQHNN